MIDIIINFVLVMYRSFVNLISDDDSEWEQDPSVQEILHGSASHGTVTSDRYVAFKLSEPL